MQVLCINEKGWMNAVTRQREPGPAFMEECTVVGHLTDLNTKHELFVLAEYMTDIDDGYQANAFVPLSDTDETEMNREHVLYQQNLKL